jgi:hypothetical protein
MEYVIYFVHGVVHITDDSVDSTALGADFNHFCGMTLDEALSDIELVDSDYILSKVV